MHSNLVLGQFPATRMRRTRQFDWSRSLVAENHLSARELIWSVFVRDPLIQRDIPTLPAVYRYGLDEIVDAVGKAYDAGIRVIALFPVLEDSKKSEDALECLNPHGLIPEVARAIKRAFPDVGIISDVALDSYTSHGHDGLVKGDVVLNDETIDLLARHAIVHAEAGVDIISPSDMLDGRIKAIRQKLDESNYHNTAILSYAAKYASCLYGPFRDALGSTKTLGAKHKKSYQLDPRNVNEALRETGLDIQEGADMVMVKPALFYLDVLTRVKEAFKVPTYAFHVSGEYAMLQSAVKAGWLNYEQGLMEMLFSCKRAGADGIISYGAVDAARFLKAGYE
jgi:porphobilinogen synthase